MNEIEKAVNKLDSAAEKMKGNYAKLVASHLIEQIRTEEAARKIMDEKKTLTGCIKEIEGKAKKQAVNGCAVIEDALVYKWAEGYFGLDVSDLPQRQDQPLAFDLLDLI